ncbi:uncharacterized protein LOC141631011 [Silene latifolia]|uniref:uncharacterized protein LOC141631011 n=1 Tax=Silene latifolia TaxID=37657 RepID=UPI003D77875A
MAHQAVYFRRDSLAQALVQTANSQPKEKSKSKGSQPQASSEEAKIRAELETDIENNLEEELKGEIYRLALRLRRLYQHQKDSRNNNTNNQVKQLVTKNDTNKNDTNLVISISMDGETKVDMKEMKKFRRVVPLRIHPKHHHNKIVVPKNGTKKFDWTTSLRSGPPKSNVQVVRHKMERGKQELRFLGRSKGLN